MELLLAWWPVLAGLVVWFVTVTVFIIRLEGLVKINKSNIVHMEQRVERVDTELKERLAKIDGRLEIIASSLERVIWRMPRRKTSDPTDNGED